MRIRPWSCSALLVAFTLAAVPLALAQPADSSKKDKDKEPSKKPALPKPPPPKPASEITLKVGDKAPLFKPDVWIKPIPAVAAAAPAIPAAASPVPSSPAAPSSAATPPLPGFTSDPLTFDPTKVYVVEFWATWCVSCREAMPTLAKLARANKDLVVIAVTSSERKPATDAPDNRMEGVRKYVESHAESFPYAVVFDGSRTIATPWISAAGRVYIPTAFIVDNAGVITFIGDPRDKAFDTAITKALKALPQAKPPEPAPEPKKKAPKPRPKN